jgi:biotin carboxyl carrier protein
MRLLVSIDGRSGALTLERGAGDRCEFEYQASDGAVVKSEASVIEVEPGVYSILTNGRSHELKVVPGPSGFYVDLEGHRSVVEVRDPRAFSRKGRAGVGEGRQTVSSPMPGKVVRVLVKVGDEVQAGDGLVVVEAMKMQNEMKSPKAGRVTQVSAKEGDTVSAGEVMIAIE